MTVISMGHKTGDARKISPKQMLEDALNDVGTNGALAKGKKSMLVCLDDSDDGYQISWYQAGMSMSECVALTEVAKQFFLRQMEFTCFKEDLYD